MPIVIYYFHTSGPCRAAIMTAQMLGVTVELKEINLLKGEQLDPEFLKINPLHCLPTLDDNGFYLTDSHAIATYFVGKYGQNSSLYPKYIKERAIVDQMLYFDATVLFPRFRASVAPLFYENAKSVSDSAKAAMKEAIEILDKHLDGKPWLAGEQLTVADICNSANVAGITAAGYDLSQHSNVAAWFERCKTAIKGFDDCLKGAASFATLIHNLHPGPLFSWTRAQRR